MALNHPVLGHFYMISPHFRAIFLNYHVFPHFDFIILAPSLENLQTACLGT
jgi:hypothetical protein